MDKEHMVWSGPEETEKQTRVMWYERYYSREKHRGLQRPQAGLQPLLSMMDEVSL